MNASKSSIGWPKQRIDKLIAYSPYAPGPQSWYEVFFLVLTRIEIFAPVCDLLRGRIKRQRNRAEVAYAGHRMANASCYMQEGRLRSWIMHPRATALSHRNLER